MKSMMVIEYEQVINRRGREKEFKDLDLSDLTITLSTIAVLDLFIITDTINNQCRIMKIRK